MAFSHIPIFLPYKLGAGLTGRDGDEWLNLIFIFGQELLINLGHTRVLIFGQKLPITWVSYHIS